MRSGIRGCAWACGSEFGIISKKKHVQKDLLNSSEDGLEENTDFQTRNFQFVDVRFQILPTKPKYLNQINIVGNHRTLENVIRREISIAEGDPISNNNIKVINKKLQKLGFFNTINIKEDFIEDDTIILDIEVDT